MDKLLAMQVFTTIVDSGSLSVAATRLGYSRPVVSRYLAEIESWAGARLLHRTTRKLTLTPAGEQLLPRCQQVLALTEEMQGAAAAPADAPSGLLRITCSTSFGQAQLAMAVAAYVARYPAVCIDMVLLDRVVHLIDERIDLALRLTQELDPNLIARRLVTCQSVVCASPAYLQAHGAPREARELASRNCLTHSYHGKSLWRFDRQGEPVTVAVGGNISADEAGTLMQAAVAGAGVVMLPAYLAAPLLRTGELVTLLPGYRPQGLDLYAVYASRKNMPASLRTMLDFLAERFSQTSEWSTAI